MAYNTVMPTHIVVTSEQVDLLEHRVEWLERTLTELNQHITHSSSCTYSANHGPLSDECRCGLGSKKANARSALAGIITSVAVLKRQLEAAPHTVQGEPPEQE